jgi:protein-arginine kinase activator protein McsA
MFRLNCESCGQPATIHETVIEDGEVITRHICQEHGVSPMQAANLGSEAPQSAEELLHRFTATEREQLALLHRLTHRRT